MNERLHEARPLPDAPRPDRRGPAPAGADATDLAGPTAVLAGRQDDGARWDPAERHRKDFIPADPRDVARIRARFDHDSPDWSLVNPRRHDGPAWDNNCCEATRAVVLTLEGRPTVAAGVKPEGRFGGGEPSRFLERWAGAAFAERAVTDGRTGLARLWDHLALAGEGTAAVVAYRFIDEDGHESGHAVAARNRGGRPMIIDGQQGVETELPAPDVEEWETDWVGAADFARGSVCYFSWIPMPKGGQS
ncbi:MAG: toxin glutamine deamidase domain-containing protein [Acidimicrobiales bacterium]